MNQLETLLSNSLKEHRVEKYGAFIAASIIFGNGDDVSVEDQNMNIAYSLTTVVPDQAELIDYLKKYLALRKTDKSSDTEVIQKAIAKFRTEVEALSL
jgi:D-alanine-D-alanine ligase-like ATP-grasp enzyme